MQKVAAALVKAQKEFGPALKTSTNPHFKSRYADLAACVEAVVESLNNAGIALIQRVAPSDSGVLVETVFVHESGEMLECGQLHVPAIKNDPQGFGSALTYARRYSLWIPDAEQVHSWDTTHSQTRCATSGGLRHTTRQTAGSEYPASCQPTAP